MKTLLIFVSIVLVVSGQGMNMGGMGGGGMNFNLSTPQGILGFLNYENINPNQLVVTNCVANGFPCTPGGQVCCLSPVMTCQPSTGGSNLCLVAQAHVNHIPMIVQILRTVGFSTPNPIK